jgi:hypothetical protein
MSATVIAVIAIILVAVGLGAIVTGIFNKLVTYGNRYKNAFAQIRCSSSGATISFPTWSKSPKATCSTSAGRSRR